MAKWLRARSKLSDFSHFVILWRGSPGEFFFVAGYSGAPYLNVVGRHDATMIRQTFVCELHDVRMHGSILKESVNFWAMFPHCV